MWGPRGFRQIATITFLFCAASSCAQKRESSIIKDCVLPDDQAGTLTAKWRVTPIPIAFHEGDFSDAEIAEITKAADTWNEFYSASLGLAPIDYGDTAVRTSTQDRIQNSMLCGQGSIVQGNAFVDPIVLYKNSSWPFTSQPNAMAITSYCRSAGKPLPTFSIAAIDFNYQNFFVSGKKRPDLQSIILHEFGHMVGLNHSCEGSARAGVPSCTSPSINTTYVQAVMYPTFSFDRLGAGEIRRDLMENDQGRANCLYMN